MQFVHNIAGAEDAAITAMATHLQLAVNSSLSVDQLKALGRPRLEELQKTLEGATPVRNEFEGYDLNDPLGEAKQHAARASNKSADEFAGYDLNKI